MYYYLSFLRPPPKAVSLAQGGITITPQIANDLRTELKEDELTDIYYTWQHIPTSPSPSSPYTSPPTKLTTYNPPQNTYKPLSIPFPPQAKPHETWRIGLFAPPATGVRGRLDSLDEHVCGVWSEGIRILPAAHDGSAGKTGNGNGSGGAKQTRVFREWSLGLGLGPNEHVRKGTAAGERRERERGSTKRDARGRAILDSQITTVPETETETLKIVEQTSFDLDKKIWDSGLALSAWLQAHLQPSHHHHQRRRLIRNSHLHASAPAHTSTSSGSSIPPTPNHADRLINAYLNRLTSLPPRSSSTTTTSDKDGKQAQQTRRTVRALELGAGTGLVSFALASAVRRWWRDTDRDRDHGDGDGDSATDEGGLMLDVDAESRPVGYDIYATDLESALPLIDENAALNSHLWTLPARSEDTTIVEEREATSETESDERNNIIATAETVDAGRDGLSPPRDPKIEIHSAVLDWEEDLPRWVHQDVEGQEVGVDIIIAADVTYNTASFPYLIKTLTSLLQPGAPRNDPTHPNSNPEQKASPLLLLAYKERDSSERELWELAKENGIWMEMVDVITGHEAAGRSEEEGDEEPGAGATEIWIGGMGERPGC